MYDTPNPPERIHQKESIRRNLSEGIHQKGTERCEDDDVSNAYLPGMYHDWVFVAHHWIRCGLIFASNVTAIARELSASPRFFV